MIKTWIKKTIPSNFLKKLRPIYHGLLALVGHWYFGRPSEKLIVIGVTGTNGKSTTVNLIAAILNEAGKKTGFASTVTWNVGKEINLNQAKITTSSGWELQKRMSLMLQNGCQYAVFEMSSEGLAQNRHLGINFDMALFTNLTPEHIEAHGGFENYKKAKSILFKALKGKHKQPEGKKIPKIIIINSDDEHSAYYKSFKADKYVSYGTKNQADFLASEINYSLNGVGYKLQAISYQLKLKGQFDVYNSLAAIAAANCLGVSLENSKTALEKIPVVPGRVEVLQIEPFVVVVDYAYEPEEMRQLYETISRWPQKRVVQVLGPCGGGRDSARIKVLGDMAGHFASRIIITTDDPYDDSPEVLGREMKAAAEKAAEKTSAAVEMILDRRQAIAKALNSAQAGETVLITGKGADQKMALANGNYVNWDDRNVVLEEIQKLSRSISNNPDKNRS